MSVAAVHNPYGWLRGVRFDLTLIVWVAVSALAAGWAVIVYPQHLRIILILNLWLLGYHHVIATMTRLVFDTDSFHENKYLVTWVPLLVVAGTLAMYTLIGPWSVTATYLYWQWFHYTRQSYGIAQAYRRKARAEFTGPARLTTWVLYALPLWGIATRSYQNPDTFLGQGIKVLPVPGLVVQALAVLAIGVVAWWTAIQLIMWHRGKIQVAYVAYMVSHLVIFFVGYIYIPSIDYGWLVLNIWHNAQYLLFVWMYNNRRFHNRVDPAHRFLSTISQRHYIAGYFAVCLLLSSLIYYGLGAVLRGIGVTPTWLPLGVLVYATINFHHYIVDGMVWRLRQPTVLKNLGIVT